MERPWSAKRLNINFRRRQTKPRQKISILSISRKAEERAEMVDPKIVKSLNEAEINLLSNG